MNEQQVLINSEQLFTNRAMELLYRIENNQFLSVIRRALTMLMPIILTGAVAQAILNFPNDAFYLWITTEHAWISVFLDMVNGVTYGMLSIILAVTFAISYSMQRGEPVDKMIFYIVTSLASFSTQLIGVKEDAMWDILGNTGYFVAMVIGLLSCELFFRLGKIEKISLRKYTIGMDAVLVNAIQSILPAAITILTFAAFQCALLYITGGRDIYTLWEIGLEEIFARVGDGYLSALLYTLLVHIFWILGFHGSHMMENVSLGHFSLVGGSITFSKSMFNTYVMIGGCGTTMCLLIAIFLFSKKKRMRNLGKLAFPIVIFNTNEILNFGMPIILNPVLAIPFICVPVLALTLSCAAAVLGILRTTCNETSWTMPVFVSGYIGSGSVAGVVLQVVILVLGVLIYMPFLKMYEKIYSVQMQEKIERLVEELQKCESRGENPDFLHRMDDTGMVTRSLLQELRIAIRQKELCLLYQPQVDADGKYIGAEALLRWNHPEYGFIYPPLIIYLAKEGGVLPDLERMIFNTAIDAIRQVSRRCDRPFKVSVNITIQSLNWDIEEYIEEKLAEYHVSTKYLWLEITEQDMLTNSEQVIHKIRQLKDAGHKLLIDDFGMGHTSLMYLQSEYFDVVKLDGSLVRDLTKKETSQKIVASVIELAKKLNVKVVAEYVENEEIYQLLSAMGCDWYQGYFFGKPMPLEKLLEKFS